MQYACSPQDVILTSMASMVAMPRGISKQMRLGEPSGKNVHRGNARRENVSGIRASGNVRRENAGQENVHRRIAWSPKEASVVIPCMFLNLAYLLTVFSNSSGLHLVWAFEKLNDKEHEYQ